MPASAASVSAMSPPFTTGASMTAADESATIARQISATRAPGTRGSAAARSRRARGSVRTAAAASSTARAVTPMKTLRQSPWLANTPPASGPISIDTLQAPEIRASTRGQVGSGNVLRTKM